MSVFVTYSAANSEYYLTTAGYAALVVLMAALVSVTANFRKKREKKQNVRQLTFCALAMALALVTSYIRIVSLPFGGSVTCFSMFFICFAGYLFGLKAGLATGVAYGLLQFICNPYIYHPLQVLLDYPMAFGALGLAGCFYNSREGLLKGVIIGVLGRYICHVLSGYIFFADYAGERNPIWYTLGYNATYILPELLVTVVLIVLPPVAGGLKEVKKMAVNS